MGVLTDEEKEGLSPEEIAAIEDDTDDGDDGAGAGDEEQADQEAAAQEEAAKAKAEADAKAKADADAAAEAAKKAKEDDDAAAAAKAKADDAAKQTPAADAEEDDDEPILPIMKPPAKEEIDKAKTAFDEAKKKFEEGEISYDEYDTAKDAYNKLQWQAETAQKANDGAREAHWQAEQNRFFKQNQAFKDKPTLNAAYVHAVNTILKSDEGAKLSDRKVLLKAKQMVEEDLGLLAGKSAAQPPDKGKDKNKDLAAAKKAAADRREIGADLGAAPSSKEENDTDEFTWLDNLTGAAYQDAVEKLTPAQRERYESR
jgi:hypothetical protein